MARNDFRPNNIQPDSCQVQARVDIARFNLHLSLSVAYSIELAMSWANSRQTLRQS